MSIDYTARERAALGAAPGICRALSEDRAYMCDLDAGHEGDHHGFELPTVTLDFDPGQDWPPEGATVDVYGETATFREGNMPGWFLTDGRYARPFDSLGLLLAQRWAANQETTHPTSPSAQCRGEGRGGAVSERGES